jgi:3-hydroxyisobutyrate dehydrogenase
MRLGFIGLGTMGLPMVCNLLRAGHALVVWNRTPARCAAAIALGARQAEGIDQLCAVSEVVLTALLDEAALDQVLGRGSAVFRRRLAGKTWVQLGTTSPSYSQSLAADIALAGGRYVEAPVSGSRGPAHAGRLVGMLAGADEDIAMIAPVLRPLCREQFFCGAVPNALRMKLAVNHYLIAMVVSLAETVHAARTAGLDLALLQRILDIGPMASEVSKAKLARLVADDDAATDAAIRDVRTIARLVADQARDSHAAAPIIDHCVDLFRAALELGAGERDMAAVVDMVAARHHSRTTP